MVRSWPHAVAVLVSLALLASCTAGSSPHARRTPSHASTTRPRATPTPLANLNTAAMTIPRVSFCDLVPGQAVRDAVDGRARLVGDYGAGDQALVEPGVHERVDEFGCRWRRSSDVPGGSGHAAARAWVFGRPVTEAEARHWVRHRRRQHGCTALHHADDFGDPSVAVWCRTEHRLTWQGLFDDTWLACEIRDPDADRSLVLDRTEAWCVQVANALNTER